MQHLFVSLARQGLVLCGFALPTFLCAQNAGLPLSSPAYPLLNRLEIIHGINSPIHPEIKPFNRQDAAAFATLLDTSTALHLSVRDRQDIEYLLADNNECLPDSSRWLKPALRHGLWRHFYRTPAHFFEVNEPGFRLRANPMLNVQLGRDGSDDAPIYQNQRGFEVRAVVDKKLFFYTNLVETQARYPTYVTERVDTFLAVPGAGFFKPFQSKVLDAPNGYDFNVATAYLGFQASKHFGLQIGHGKHFVGNGYRSMFLSDYAAPAFYLQLDTRVWRLHYQNLFLELSPVSQVQIPDGTLLPKKYAAMHYLNFEVTPRLALGFFEATIFNRSRQFEFQYLNPLILYRTVEGMIGSPDNVVLGFDGRWNLFRCVQLYGQVLLDELVSAEVFSGSGWWANKWGLQFGAKYLNALGVEHLDIQVEHNRARPYTYAHHDPYNSYTHYNQALAHPLGANFDETLLLLSWQPWRRLSLQGKYMRARAGDNAPGANWGANPLLDYNTRVQDYGNEIGQGTAYRLQLLGVSASWLLGHNIALEAQYLFRKKDSTDPAADRSAQVFSAGLHMNLWNPALDF